MLNNVVVVALVAPLLPCCFDYNVDENRMVRWCGWGVMVVNGGAVFDVAVVVVVVNNGFSNLKKSPKKNLCLFFLLGLVLMLIRIKIGWLGDVVEVWLLLVVLFWMLLLLLLV